MMNSHIMETLHENMSNDAYKTKLRSSKRCQYALLPSQVEEEQDSCNLRDQQVGSLCQMSDSVPSTSRNSVFAQKTFQNNSQEIKIENESLDKNTKLESDLIVPIKTEDTITKATPINPVPVIELETSVMRVEKEIPRPKRQKKKYHHKPRNYWLDSEDEKLLELIDEFGEKWSKIAAALKGRSGKQIRDRYINYLRPNIKQREWTKEEDDLLTNLFDEFGNKWSKIAAYLPGRTENQVKNRFYAAARKEKRREEKRKRLAKNDPELVKFVKLDTEKPVALPVKPDLPANIHQIAPTNPLNNQTYNFTNYLTQFPPFSFNTNMINKNNFFVNPLANPMTNPMTNPMINKIANSMTNPMINPMANPMTNPMGFNTNLLQAYAKNLTMDRYPFVPPMQEQRFDQVSTFSTHLSSRGESPAAVYTYTEESSPLSPGALRTQYLNQEQKPGFLNGKFFDIKTEAI